MPSVTPPYKNKARLCKNSGNTNKRKELRLVNINLRSVTNKIDSLESMLMQYDPHIAVITETWLREEISDDEVFPPCYNVYRKDRSARGGGVAILVKPDIEATIAADVGILECLCVQLSCWGHSFILYACYRPPDAIPEYLTFLKEHMSRFFNKQIFLVGDLNLPSVDWEGLTCSQFSKNANTVFDIMLAHDLTQIVRQPTRVQGHASSILDLVFVKRAFSGYTVVVEQGLSDHELVSVTIPLFQCSSHQKSPMQYFKDYSRADDDRVIEYMEAVLAEFNDDALGTCALWEKFVETCQYCINNFIPSKPKRTHKRTQWMTHEIVKLKRKVKRLRKQHAQRAVIKEHQRILAEKMHRSKEYYFKTLMPDFIKNDPSKFWNYLKDRKKPISKIVLDSRIVTNPGDIANHFNTYFHSVFNVSGASTFSVASSQPFEVNFISYAGLVSMLVNLNTKKSCGPDELPNVFLRRYAEYVGKFLFIIFNASLSTATLPRDWKMARVAPIFKKGDRLSVPNYRPISLTSSCCKLIEHIIANQITEFLETHSILTHFQHGFRKKYSTVTQLVTVAHAFASALDDNIQIDTIFLDFCKAFDKVPHEKLIYKLNKIGLPKVLVAWVAEYLNNRVQYVAIEGQNSSLLPVTSGVPQGSVLGPLLFLCYINDIVDVIEPTVQIRLFADDCVLFREIHNKHDQIELHKNLDYIYKWCNKWGMIVNTEKTVSMCITRKKYPLHYAYSLGSSTLKQVNNYKYLGVTFTTNLSWNSHIENICASAFRKLCFLRHKLRNSPSSVKLLCYQSYIRPKLEYACVVWDPYTKCNIDKLERIQRKAVRFIYSKFRHTDSPSELMSANNIPLLQSRRRQLRLDFLSSLLNHRVAIDPSLYLTPLSTRYTRHHQPNSFTPYFARTDTYKFSFFPRTVSEWNTLSECDRLA